MLILLTHVHRKNVGIYGTLHLFQNIVTGLTKPLRYCLCGCVSVCVSVNTFKLEYLRNLWANRNQILSEASLGRGKECVRFWTRSDQNSGVHGNQ